MLKRILIFVIFLLVPTILGIYLGDLPGGLLLGGLLGLYLVYLDWQLETNPTANLLAGSVGAGIGVVVAMFLISNIVVFSTYFLEKPLRYQHSLLIPLCLIVLLFAYLGIYAGVAVARDRSGLALSSEDDLSIVSPKMLDTSVIIDGRIVEIIEAGFLEGTMLVPKFIIKELQNMADSGNRLKRERGRRGLDILNKVRDELPVEVLILENNYPNIPEVDSKLVAYSSELGARIVTNDFNLNKVARLQGVGVLNINELSNAVKPVFIPGETFEIEIIKEGEEEDQGVGYLPDGTMVVVEEGGKYVGQKTSVTVTSVIQTSAGRMIFAQQGEDALS